MGAFTLEVDDPVPVDGDKAYCFSALTDCSAAPRAQRILHDAPRSWPTSF